MTRAEESNAREKNPIRYLAKKEPCRYCTAEIVVALCRDGRWRTFDSNLTQAAPANVWAWRRHLGMEETDRAPGYRLHFCAEYDDAHNGVTGLGELLGGTR